MRRRDYEEDDNNRESSRGSRSRAEGSNSDRSQPQVEDEASPTLRRDRRGLASANEETRRNVARMGGAAVAREYGPEFFSRIGRKGGETTAREYGPEFYSEIGHKGGQTVARERGREFYQEIGREGGRARGNQRASHRQDDSFEQDSREASQYNEDSSYDRKNTNR